MPLVTSYRSVHRPRSLHWLAATALLCSATAATRPAQAGPSGDNPRAGAPAPTAPAAEEPAPAARASVPATNPPLPGIDHDPPLPPGHEPRPLPVGLGRARAEAASGRAWLWVPRVIFFPLYLTSEFVVRRPLDALLTVDEEYHLRKRFYDILTFGAHRQFGIFPTGRVDLGLRPSVGVFVFWNDIVGASDLRLRATTGGSRWWVLDGLWRDPLTGRSDLSVRVAISKRADRSFFGFGPLSDGNVARFEETREDLRLSYERTLPPWSLLTTYMGQRWVALDPGLSSPGQESLSDAIATGRFPAPPALDGGLLALYTGAKVRVDTRGERLIEKPRRPADYEHRSATGVELTARIEQVAGLRSTRATAASPARAPHWLDYGASLLGSVDLTGGQRRVDLELLTEFTDPLPDSGGVPFTEQVSLGGAQPLRGFRDHRLVDRSAAVATLSYRWPIWVSLDGALQYAVGNVFGEHLSGFEPRLLRSSFGLGVDTAGASDNPFEALLAFGTEPFGAGGGVDSVRFVFGTRSGF